MTAAAAARRPRIRLGNAVTMAALALSAVTAAEYWAAPSRLASPAAPVRAPLDPAALRPGYGARTYEEALARADEDVHWRRERVARNSDDWLEIEQLAGALVGRWRLTARVEDLAEADRLLDRGVGIAPWPAGPVLSRALVSLSIHDLDGAEAALRRFDASAVPAPIAERLQAQSIRCEIAFERGRLALAQRLCDADQGDLGLAQRRANIAAKTGHSDEAARILEDLLRRPRLPPFTLALLELQRASVALSAGDWPMAGRWARAAQAAFPGYWLSEAFVAQQFVLEGDREEARRRYAALAVRTGDADVFDALALLDDSPERAAEANVWASRAGAAWQARVRLLPKAYASHFAEHMLLHGDPRLGLALAQSDYRRRPYPPAIAHYAFALWRSGDPARALDVARRGEAGGFLTADLKLAEAVSLSDLGRAEEAGDALLQARRLNPNIDDFRQRFVAFGQD